MPETLPDSTKGWKAEYAERVKGCLCKISIVFVTYNVEIMYLSCKHFVLYISWNIWSAMMSINHVNISLLITQTPIYGLWSLVDLEFLRNQPVVCYHGYITCISSNWGIPSRRDPLCACRLFFFFFFSPRFPSAAKYGILGGQTQWRRSCIDLVF